MIAIMNSDTPVNGMLMRTMDTKVVTMVAEELMTFGMVWPITCRMVSMSFV